MEEALSELGRLVLYAASLALCIWATVVIIRFAVRSGIKRAVKDILADPAMKLQILDLLHPDLAEPEQLTHSGH